MVDSLFHTTSVLRTLREQLGLGPALTRRDEAAPTLEVAFNRSEPHVDRPAIAALPYTAPTPPTDAEKKAAFGDAPDLALLVAKDKEHVSQIGAATLRNAARRFEQDLDDLPRTATAAREWLAHHVARDDRLPQAARR